MEILLFEVVEMVHANFQAYQLPINAHSTEEENTCD